MFLCACVCEPRMCLLFLIPFRYDARGTLRRAVGRRVSIRSASSRFIVRPSVRTTHACDGPEINLGRGAYNTIRPHLVCVIYRIPSKTKAKRAHTWTIYIPSYSIIHIIVHIYTYMHHTWTNRADTHTHCVYKYNNIF